MSIVTTKNMRKIRMGLFEGIGVGVKWLIEAIVILGV